MSWFVLLVRHSEVDKGVPKLLRHSMVLTVQTMHNCVSLSINKTKLAGEHQVLKRSKTFRGEQGGVKTQPTNDPFPYQCPTKGPCWTGDISPTLVFPGDHALFPPLLPLALLQVLLCAPQNDKF